MLVKQKLHLITLKVLGFFCLQHNLAPLNSRYQIYCFFNPYKIPLLLTGWNHKVISLFQGQLDFSHHLIMLDFKRTLPSRVEALNVTCSTQLPLLFVLCYFGKKKIRDTSWYFVNLCSHHFDNWQFRHEPRLNCGLSFEDSNQFKLLICGFFYLYMFQ